MSDDVFDGHVLAEKLFKLNSSQQSIESLSRMCITHRKKAKQIVETWHKSFKSAQREQRVSFLYLANDILQNSRRKGNEFVNEFWKVLPAALKHVYDNGDEHGKKAASRLVDIWDERRVFGSRGQNLKDEMLGKNPLPQLTSNGKSSNLIKLVKRDAHSLRLKLAVGGMPEKVMTAFQLVHDENVNEETALNNCEAVVRRFGDLERDVESVSTQGNLQESASLIDEIQEQENALQQCVSQLESAEATRTSLVSQLTEALQDQESKLELIHTQLQAARRQIEQAVNTRQKLLSPSVPTSHTTPLNQPQEVTRVVESNLPSVQVASLVPSAAQIVMSFATTTEEENKKAAAAAVAAKLSASASSAQMLTSVLSSLVAEEAASSISSGFQSFPSMFSPEKRLKLEKPMDVSNSEAGNAAYFNGLAPLTSMPNQTPFPPPPPPPPPVLPGNSPANQFVQSAGLMMGVMPYVYGASSLPPPPPLPSHIAMGLARPAAQLSQSQQSQQQQQQQAASSGYYRPPGIGFYGQNHPQPTPPPVPRQ